MFKLRFLLIRIRGFLKLLFLVTVAGNVAKALGPRISERYNQWFSRNLTPPYIRRFIADVSDIYGVLQRDTRTAMLYQVVKKGMELKDMSKQEVELLANASYPYIKQQSSVECRRQLVNVLMMGGELTAGQVSYHQDKLYAWINSKSS